MVGSITLLSRFNDSLRLMVPAYSRWMISLAGSGFTTEEDHLKIKILTSLMFIMFAHYLVICKNVSKNDKLKLHPIGVADLNKIITAIFVCQRLVYGCSPTRTESSIYH